MQISRFRNNCGVTITELMVAVGVLGIIASVSAVMFTMGFRSWRQSYAQIEVQGDARKVLDLIERNLRQATASTVVISQTSGQPAYSKISFTKVNGDAMEFYQTNDKLYQKVDTNVNLLSNNVQNVLFSYPDTSDSYIVGISVTLQKSTYGGGAKTIQLSVEKVQIKNP
ncbi:MAG: prepilin-type N-terminal cleavage/methylation domain-containing protein [Candidatus Firestonebacteria bacterium]